MGSTTAAYCAPQTHTAQVVIIQSHLEPYNAVGGTDNGLGPTRKSDEDPMGMTPPSGKTPTSAPGPQMIPWAAPPPASCTLQTPTAWAVIVWSPVNPYDAMGGTEDSFGPPRKWD